MRPLQPSRTSPRPRLAVIAVTLMATATAAPAQEPVVKPERKHQSTIEWEQSAQGQCYAKIRATPGKWQPLPPPQIVTGFGATEADMRALAAQLPPFLEPFRALETLSPPVGMDVEPSIYVSGRQDGRPIGSVSMMFMSQLCDPEGRPLMKSRTQRRMDDNGGVGVSVNDIGVLLGHPRWTDSVGPVYRAPEGKPFRGRTQWDGKWVAITKRDAPMWVPVSQERVLRWKIAEARRETPEVEKGAEKANDLLEKFLRERPQRVRDFEKGMETLKQVAPEKIPEIKANFEKSERELEAVFRKQSPSLKADAKKGVEAHHQRVAALEAELEAMPPEERRAPARFGSTLRGPSGLARADDRTAWTLAVPNPDFFDRSLPRTVVQLVVVTTGDGTTMHPADRIARELDYSVFERMVR